VDGVVGCAGVAGGGVVQGVYGSAVTPWKQMAVDLRGEGCRVVTELLLESASRNTTLRTPAQLCRALRCEPGDLFRSDQARLRVPEREACRRSSA